MSLPAALARVATRFPERDALVHRDTRLTYAELMARIDATACGLEAAGIGRGDRVALQLANGPHYVEGLFAVMQTGAIAVPIDPRLPAPWIEQIIATTDVAMTLATDPDDPRPLHECAALPHGATQQSPEPAPHDPAAIFHTAGTSGHPLGVLHSHAGLLRAAGATAQSMRRSLMPSLAPARMIRTIGLYRKLGKRLTRAAHLPVLLVPVALQNISGQSSLAGALLGGGRFVITDGFHPHRVLELVEREGVTNLGGTPMMLELLVRVKREFDTSSLVLTMAGGSLASPKLLRNVADRFGCAAGVAYGATELGGPVCFTRLDDPEKLRVETVGHPLDKVDIRVDAPNGEAGELHVRVVPTMLGYWNQPERTAARLDANGWYRTGDLGIGGGRGTIRILGRIDDVVHRNGTTIRATEVERALEELDGVREAAVVSAPDRDEIRAVVVAEPGATHNAISAAVHAALDPRLAPDTLTLCNHLPRTTDGKVRKDLLRADVLPTDEEPWPTP